MVKEVIVISLGGSQILKDGEINYNFLDKFRNIIKKHRKDKKIVVVCGGGSVARIYINGLVKDKKNEKLQSFAGISVTRHNARFMSYFFGGDNEEGIPHTLDQLKKMLAKNGLVFTGALEYKPKQTSDSTAAQIAQAIGSEFINITNVDGLYTSNPKTNKNAKLIREISWKDFYILANKLSFKPGQHFVLDQSASKIIMDNKIRTYIVGENLDNLDKVLSNKDFCGTLISG